MATNAICDMLRLKESPSKGQRKVVRPSSVLASIKETGADPRLIMIFNAESIIEFKSKCKKLNSEFLFPL